MLAGIVIGYIFKNILSAKKIKSSEGLATRIVEEAKKEAETIKKEAILQAKEKFLQLKAEHEQILTEKNNKIAQIENQCLHPPSAWAYPKPKASQVLCKNNHHTCPHYVSGWNISVISTQEAIGYIGTNLRPGSYPKCRLEKDLEDINK